MNAEKRKAETKSRERFARIKHDSNKSEHALAKLRLKTRNVENAAEPNPESLASTRLLSTETSYGNNFAHRPCAEYLVSFVDLVNRDVSLLIRNVVALTELELSGASDTSGTGFGG